MAKFFMTKETAYTLEFTDYKDVLIFLNKADNEFGAIGSIDALEPLTVKVSFENKADADKFETFVSEELGEPARWLNRSLKN